VTLSLSGRLWLVKRCPSAFRLLRLSTAKLSYMEMLSRQDFTRIDIHVIEGYEGDYSWTIQPSLISFENQHSLLVTKTRDALKVLGRELY
jgi:hypothetical protein